MDSSRSEGPPPEHSNRRVLPPCARSSSYNMRSRFTTLSARAICMIRLIICAAPVVLSMATSAFSAEPVESKFLSNIREVTSGFVKAGEGYFSPDGQMIVYQAQPLDYPF